MSFPATPPDPHCLPYDQASPAQVSQALLFLQQRLAAHFPTLSWVTWAQALLYFRPDLWVEGPDVFLDEAEVTQLAQFLADSDEIPQLDPIIYNSRARYLAKRLVNYQDQAIAALSELEAYPHAYGPQVYALVIELAQGNGIANEVFQATHRRPTQRPGGADPALARAAATARIWALRRARGEVGFAGPAPVPST